MERPCTLFPLMNRPRPTTRYQVEHIRQMVSDMFDSSVIALCLASLIAPEEVHLSKTDLPHISLLNKQEF